MQYSTPSSYFQSRLGLFKSCHLLAVLLISFLALASYWLSVSSFAGKGQYSLTCRRMRWAGDCINTMKIGLRCVLTLALYCRKRKENLLDTEERGL